MSSERPPIGSGGDLERAIEERAGQLGGVESVTSAGLVAYRRDGVEFATRRGATFAFRLRPEIVAAALRTPDTAPVARGPEWVELNAARLDTFTLDRAMAWFEAAWRFAGEAAEQGRTRPH